MGMRVAFLIAGQIRNWDGAYSHFKNLKKCANSVGIELDFFLASWNKEGEGSQDYKGNKELDIDTDFFKSVAIDPIIEYHPGSSYYMTNRWQRVIQLRQDYEKEHSIVYDLVILTRPDIVISPYQYFFERCSFLCSERGIEWNNPLTILTEVGSTVHHRVDKQSARHRKIKGDMLYLRYSDDKVIIGHPYAIDTFKGLYNDIVAQRITAQQHTVIVEHCFRNKIFNRRLFVDIKNPASFKLNRQVDYPQ